MCRHPLGGWAASPVITQGSDYVRALGTPGAEVGRVKMEGGLMLIKHPYISLCVQANPALPQRCNVHPRSISLLICARRIPMWKDMALLIRAHRRTGQLEKTPNHSPAESCVTTGKGGQGELCVGGDCWINSWMTMRIFLDYLLGWWDAVEGLG